MKIIQAQAARNESNFTLIQNFSLLLLHDQHDKDTGEELSHHAVRASKEIGLHRIQVNDGSNLNEVKVRTWWFLVSRSWFGSLSNTTNNSIQSEEFNTRLPMENANLDLHPDRPTDEIASTSMSEMYLPSRFALTQIRLSTLIRCLVEYRYSNKTDFAFKVQEEFEIFSEDIEYQYHLIVNGGNRNLEMGNKLERWMVHQQLFHAFLEFQQLDYSLVSSIYFVIVCCSIVDCIPRSQFPRLAFPLHMT